MLDDLADRTYRPSGIVPPAGALLLLAAALGTGVVAGAVYGIIGRYNPFIYITFLGAMGLGSVAGIAVAWAGRRGRVRNRLALRVAGLLGGGAALYAAWAGWICALSDWKVVSADPQVLWALIGVIYETGAWTIGSGKEPVSGLPLAAVWVIEAGVILGFAQMTCAVSDAPFCESAGAWAEERGEVAILAPVDDEAVRAAFTEGRTNALQELDGRPAEFLSVHLFGDPTGGDENFVRVRAVRMTVDKEGKPKAKERTVLPLLRIDRALHDRLAARKAFAPPPAATPPVADGAAAS